MIETICTDCNGEGCSTCHGVGVIQTEEVRIAPASQYDVNKSFIANLHTHTLQQIILRRAGESTRIVKEAREELARRGICTI